LDKLINQWISFIAQHLKIWFGRSEMPEAKVIKYELV